MQLVCFKDTQLFNVTLHQNSELDSLRLGLTFNTESQGTIYSYFEISLKPAVVSCLTNALDLPPIALESCSRAQKIRQVF